MWVTPGVGWAPGMGVSSPVAFPHHHGCRLPHGAGVPLSSPAFGIPQPCSSMCSFTLYYLFFSSGFLLFT